MRSLQVKKQLLAFFMPGFLIGILYANCFLKQTIVDTNLFDIEILKKYTEINSFGNIYFLYIVQIRLIPFALLMALAFTKIKKLLMPIVVSGSAFSIGILLTVAVIKMGMKGVLLCIVSVIPQTICYVPAYLVLLIYCMQYPSGQWSRQKTVFVFGMLMIGMMIEVYLTPVIIRSILRQY